MKIGLTLGGGAARGLAHIGIIDVLEENGILAEVVTGTSIGAIVGAAYSAGVLEDLKDFFLSVDILKMLSFYEVGIRKTGLIDGKKLSKFFEENMKIPDIEELDKRFAAIACDYHTGERVVIDQGDTVTALRASYSIPGLFTPVRYKGRLLLDGGIVDPVPVGAARELGAERIIAVDLNHHVRWRNQKPEKNKGKKDWKFKQHPLWKAMEEKFESKDNKEISPGLIEIMVDSFYLMEMHLANYTLAISRPDIILRPNLRGITFLDFNRAEEGIKIGRALAEDKMEEITKALDE